MTALLSALTAHKDALPDTIKSMVEAHSEANTATKAKAMHRCVATQATGTRQLQMIRSQREQYLQAWRTYLDDLGKGLQKQMEEKVQVLADFAATEETLVDAIEQAREQVLQMAGGDQSKTGDFMDLTEPGTENAELKIPELPSHADLQAKEDSLLEALKMAQEQAADAAREVKRERTPRRTDKTKDKDGEMVAISSDEQGL